MKKMLLQQLKAPALRFVGTFSATFILGMGVTQPTVDTITLGIVAICGIGFDFVISRVYK